MSNIPIFNTFVFSRHFLHRLVSHLEMGKKMGNFDVTFLSSDTSLIPDCINDFNQLLLIILYTLYVEFGAKLIARTQEENCL